MTLLNVAARVARSLGFPGLPDYARALRGRYNPPSQPRAVLSAAFFESVERKGGSLLDAPTDSGVYSQWACVPGGHKWLHYFEEYDDLFVELRSRPIRMLEIGVYRGASLGLWRKYLHPDSVIVGIDIDSSCSRFDNPVHGVHVRIGSQEDAAFLDSVCKEFGPFDVILDDGSHLSAHMIASFNHLFLPALTERGLYIAEDTHANFWWTHRKERYSFVDLCKDLVDEMHSHYPTMPSELLYRGGHPEQVRSLLVSRLSAQIREISFRDSIIAIQKKPIGPLPVCIHN